jgi:hypothetical protein
MMVWPVTVEPVNEILSTPGCFTRAEPAMGPWPGTTLSDAGRQACLREDRSQHERGERGLGRGLQHHRASGREGRSDLPAREVEREVPGHDGAHDTHGDPLREHEVAGVHRPHLTAHLVGPARVVAQHLHRLGDVDLRLEQRLAVLPGLDLRELLGALLEQIRGAGQHGPALPGRELPPRVGLEARAGRGDRGIHVGDAGRLHGREDLFRGGVDDLERVARGRRPPRVVHEQLGVHYAPLKLGVRFST